MMLGGDGGDELFGGNVRYAKQHLFSLYEQDTIAVAQGNYRAAGFWLSRRCGIALDTEGAQLHRAGVDTHARPHGNIQSAGALWSQGGFYPGVPGYR